MYHYQIQDLLQQNNYLKTGKFILLPICRKYLPNFALNIFCKYIKIDIIHKKDEDEDDRVGDIDVDDTDEPGPDYKHGKGTFYDVYQDGFDVNTKYIACWNSNYITKYIAC